MKKTCHTLETLPLDKISIKEIELAIHNSCDTDEQCRLNELLRWKERLLLCNEALRIIDLWEKDVK